MAAKFKGHVKNVYVHSRCTYISNDGAVSVTLTRNKVGGGMLCYNPIKANAPIQILKLKPLMKHLCKNNNKPTIMKIL